MSWQGKTRQVAFMEEEEEDDDDLFGTNDDDEDFNLFDNKSKFKSPTTSKFNKAKSISEVSLPLPATTSHQHHHTNPATPVPTSAAIGLFGNSGKQNINGVTNLVGLTQGVLNGSVILGHNNSITVCNC